MASNLRAVNEREYIFPLGVAAKPDDYTRDFCCAIYKRPMTNSLLMKFKKRVAEIIADLEADEYCWLEMNIAWRKEKTCGK